MGLDLHGLGWIDEAKAYFLGFGGLGGFSRHLHCQDLLVFFEHLLGFDEAGFHVHGEIEGFGEGEVLLLVVISDGEVGLQGEDSSGVGIFNTR
jgi:hypothetical protein